MSVFSSPIIKWLAAGGLLVALVLAISGPRTVWEDKQAEAKEASPAYATRMVELIAAMHDYAQKQHDGFLFLSNGGTSLFLPVDGNTEENAKKLAASVDGVLAESVFFGWDDKAGKETPKEERGWFERTLGAAQDFSLPVFTLDYLKGSRHEAEAYAKYAKYGYVGWASFDRQLTTVPDEEPYAANTADVRTLQDVQNFLVLLNPMHYHTKADYLAALAATDYDLLIIDPYYGGAVLTPADLGQLRHKAHGGRRLVLAYLSVGEAEPYRPYWQPKWKQEPPAWLAARNETWGSYKVRYWEPEWQAILYGKPTSGLDQIIRAGFDGAFLDVIDAYLYFQDSHKDAKGV